ncbi:MAG: DUF3307 domain-containing protein [Lachnospiraceae bacterium]|nr:DUF3307 domain-containing protein [Lachnospiraceae bacterium]
MWIELFLCLWLAHLVADFGLQKSASCKSKAEKHWLSIHQYTHAGSVFALSWLASFDIRFWWGALIIGALHLCIDVWKSYRTEKVVWFSLDQILHMLVLAGVAWLWGSMNEWRIPFGVEVWWIAAAIAVLICWKPSNIFIKLVLQHYSVNMPQNKDEGFNAGALIGTIERWLILIFVCLQRYDALGLLIAAKSIIRFGDSQTNKSEYVLAGTLLSIFIAVLAGLGVMMVRKFF